MSVIVCERRRLYQCQDRTINDCSRNKTALVSGTNHHFISIAHVISYDATFFHVVLSLITAVVLLKIDLAWRQMSIRNTN